MINKVKLFPDNTITSYDSNDQVIEEYSGEYDMYLHQKIKHYSDNETTWEGEAFNFIKILTKEEA